MVRLSLPHLANPAVREEALRTITVITGDRPAWLLVSSSCFVCYPLRSQQSEIRVLFKEHADGSTFFQHNFFHRKRAEFFLGVLVLISLQWFI